MDRSETTKIVLTEDTLNPSDALSFVFDNAAGATDLFVGSTRRVTGGQITKELYYEAHKSLAVTEMRRLSENTHERFDIIRVAIYHRLGVVPIGQASVLIAVSAPHRDAAFRACRFLIDELKARVPIWKRETFQDGTMEWVDPLGTRIDRPEHERE